MNQHVAIFSRAAGITIKKILAQHRANPQDRLQLLINNMNLINQTLTTLAVKMMNKTTMRGADKEELATNLRDIIYISVMSYAKRAY